MKRTKLLSVILALVLTFSLAACGNKNTTTNDAKNNTTNSEATTDDTTKEVEKSAIEVAVNDYFTSMPEDIYKINQAKFIEKVQAGEDIFVLDIRTAEDYAAGHITGAVNAPWGTAISDNLDKLPSDKTIMVYCYTGQTAGQTVALLNMAGFDAKSVNLGWMLGISKVEGYEDVTETTVTEFPEVEALSIDADIEKAIKEYYAGLADVKETQFKNYKISEDNAKKAVDTGDDTIVFLSIRSAEDFAAGHIEGATNIPWGNDMAEQFGTLPTDKTIVVYCYTGQTAGQTVAALRLLGLDAVSLNGGMGMEKANPGMGWGNKGFEVVQ
ncbi:hypothetical protein SH2C18_11600 [Clostridium sediminicola]|uniref:rhodanese-like domain-containing protein n=1 Tax=Clostridium sediminicola TaxID=3114879 RepID=UPI0031F21061